MTQRQLQTLRYIESFIAERGYSPSYAEIAAGIGIVSKNTVSQLVHALRDQGRITMRAGRDRSIELCGTSLDLSNVPTFLLVAEIAKRKAEGAEVTRV